MSPKKTTATKAPKKAKAEKTEAAKPEKVSLESLTARLDAHEALHAHVVPQAPVPTVPAPFTVRTNETGSDVVDVVSSGGEKGEIAAGLLGTARDSKGNLFTDANAKEAEKAKADEAKEAEAAKKAKPAKPGSVDKGGGKGVTVREEPA